MPDLKITQFTADTTPEGADLITSVQSPFGAGSNRKMTVANFMQNQTIDWKTTGRIAFGNAASLGPAPIYDGSTYDKIFDFTGTITDFSSADYWAPFKSYVNLDPSIDIDTTTIYGHDLEVIIPATNSKDIGYVYGEYRAAVNLGSGDIDTWAGAIVYTYHGGNGTVTNLYGDFIISINGDIGTVVNNTGLLVRTGNGGAGFININKGIIIDTPYTAGLISNSYGLYIEDQTSALNNWAIYVVGGQSYFGGFVGIGTFAPRTHLEIATNPKITFSDSGFFNPFTDFEDIDVFGEIEMFYVGNGGVLHTAYSEGDATPYMLSANYGSTTPTNSVIIFDVAKSDGTTGKAALDIPELAFQITNLGNEILKVTGGGNVQVIGSVKSGGGFTTDGNLFYVDETGYLLTQFIEVPYGISISQRNIVLGSFTAGASAQKVLALGDDATPPVTSADVAQLFAQDIGIGRATLAMVTEETVNADVSLVSTHSGIIFWNGSKYKIPLVLVP